MDPLGGGPPVTPRRKRKQDRDQFATTLGEAVAVPDRVLLVRLLGGHATGDERVEAAVSRWGEMPRSSTSWSKRFSPRNKSRSTSGDHQSPTTSSERAREHCIDAKLVWRVPLE